MARRGDVRLGDTIKDTITGLTGVCVAIHEWLNGCQTISLQPREVKDGKPVERQCFDIEQLELVESVQKPEKPLALRTGGPERSVTTPNR